MCLLDAPRSCAGSSCSDARRRLGSGLTLYICTCIHVCIYTYICVLTLAPVKCVSQVRPDLAAEVPSVTHVDGSARLQTVDETRFPLFHAIIRAFLLLSGVPLILNTSFNLADVPMVRHHPSLFLSLSLYIYIYI